MIKRIVVFVVLVVCLCVLAYVSHNYSNVSSNAYLRYVLLNVYLYHVVAAVVTYVLVEFVANKLPNSAGYAYLASMCVKIGFFVLIFQSSVFSITAFTTAEKLGLIIPLFLFLILEAGAIFKLLNNKSF